MPSTALATTPPRSVGAPNGGFAVDKSRRDSYNAEVIRLRERVEELEGEVAYLKDIVSPPGLIFPTRWRLTEKEARLLRALMAAPHITKEVLLVALYDTEPDVEIKIVDVFVCKLRGKLAGDGIRIETLWGAGYRIEPPVKAVIQEAAAAARSGVEWTPNRDAIARPKAHVTARIYTGAELKEQRHALNLSQHTVAKMANLAHLGYVSSVEAGGASSAKHHIAIETALRDERRRRCIPDPKPAGVPPAKQETPR